MSDIKPLAFYLPQYHPIPQNDEWWGKGFTEWTNVGKAKPLFKGHKQPKVPADLGYYDLRVPEVREQQANMAKEYGVYGFIYYHYWFGNGKQVLERIANEVLATGKPDFPFCFCWANETWSGIWHGLTNRILVEQTYPMDEDIVNHFNYLLSFFKDDRYIKVDGKPLLMIYDIEKIAAQAPTYIAELNKLAIANGLKGIYFCASNKNPDNLDFKQMGVDAKVSNAFQKAWTSRLLTNTRGSFYTKVIRRIKYELAKIARDSEVCVNDASIIVKEMEFIKTNVPTFPCIIANWDNTPRSGYRGLILKNTTPKLFLEQLKKSEEFLIQHAIEPSFVILKSWNEWAEGNMLEPDMENGYSYLNVLKAFINRN
ncbi:lipopolysaccharide biosynthesis protein [Sphingobacterium sp. SGG-5]|uniref:glycosyltransferase WbsX family protein n=1 Tax=Sphingobacterium sp. SGG-5 TaxID=2710881 RepID=UPI0013EA9C6A|nr:glycoside hydrolase family 99-like domain-containing protein [Sphingobacterium sp. SGG-5]NGM63427.1 lipopolysaccharide biosynthesis protein [Sphingobacterium sp. SGG-5]